MTQQRIIQHLLLTDTTMVLYAGPLQMLYDRGFLRYIGYRDSEILRMIYFAARDENWDTYDHVITREEKDITWETFIIEYDSVHRKDNQDVIRWKCKIEGFPDSSIRFTIDGEVLKEFKRNRVGFCILHPLKNLIGQPAESIDPNGKTQTGLFPVLVAPQNPFKNIRKLKWNFENRWYELIFEGDIFETEDQRNWSDASFKTFCTPADLPIPVTLPIGTKIFQRTTFRPLERLQPITSHENPIIQLEKTDQRAILPKVGLGLANENVAANKKALERIKQLNLDHVAIDVKPSQSDWISAFSQRCENAYALGLSLKVTLYLLQEANEHLNQFILLVQQNRLRIKEVLVLTEDNPVTSTQHLKAILTLREKLPDVKFGAGTEGDFKEVNRNRFDATGIDFISYSANPQVHAVDDRTLIENIDGLRETGKSAALLFNGQAIHITPITLQSRSVRKPDPRQKTDLAALWTLGALRATSEGKVSSITLFETFGDSGIVSPDGEPFPVYFMLERVLRFRNHEIVILTNSEPLLIDAMLFTDDSSTTLMIANYTDDLQTVKYGRNEFQVPPLQVYEINLSGT
jgi:D-apionolactonase